jgi:hypothetical protein
MEDVSVGYGSMRGHQRVRIGSRQGLGLELELELVLELG